MNRISEKSIVNTCKMYTLGVDFLTASLQRIPSQVEFSLEIASSRSLLKFLLDSLQIKHCPQMQYTIP